MSSKPGPPSPPPFASDEDSVETPLAAAAPPQLGPTLWMSFSGALNESGASFVQSVQRIAFTQNRIKDDEWIAEYASTCFTDSAMVWYLGLEKETRLSWEKLRLALVQSYPVPPPKPSTPAQSKTSSPAIVDTGRIEVLRPEYGDRLGYLSRDSEKGEIVVTANPDNALKLKMVLHTDSKHQHKRIYSLKMLDMLETQFPYVGLRLVKLAAEDPDRVPSTKTSEVSWDSVQGVPWCCNISDRLLEKAATRQSRRGGPAPGMTPTYTAFATWSFVQATESTPGPYYIRKAEGQDQKARVVSAVWTVINVMKDATELGLTWPKGDNREGNAISEIGVDAVLHKGGTEGLHAHAYDFPRGASFDLDESHVVFLFKPIPNP